MPSKRVSKFTKEELAREEEECSLNTSIVFNTANLECYGEVVVMITTYKKLDGGFMAFAQFSTNKTDDEALKYLKEATRRLEAKIAGKASVAA